ncbi:hypothetical protein [Sphingomonas nostoxanthinifaciens]|uniref:hypothetical protein n=1 Tax=Sphingomonas nostoxanthinifaciens TaxID=2872652 RepID=UPI001CC1F692|nr:hypothetical protein [Sphingomonas nostoxanthinifaciens]UAK25693.1 hypothetical protein K8P63_06030 [Sphingomonas nostoxanthinifaciens]
MSTGGGFAASLPGAPTALPAKVHSIAAGNITPPPDIERDAGNADGTPTTEGTYTFTVHCVHGISGGTVDLSCTITVS